MLIAYAGKEPRAFQSIRAPQQSRAYDKFMSGMDTLQIADMYRVTERTALRWVNNERSLRHGLPSPYGAQQ